MRDADGQQIAYVYYESEPGRRSAAKLLSKNEARRIAANIAKLALTRACTHKSRCMSDGCPMSALPPKADMDHHGRDVRFVPILLQKSFWLVDQKISRP